VVLKAQKGKRSADVTIPKVYHEGFAKLTSFLKYIVFQIVGKTISATRVVPDYTNWMLNSVSSA